VNLKYGKYNTLSETKKETQRQRETERRRETARDNEQLEINPF
jgi:hypothetical protein